MPPTSASLGTAEAGLRADPARHPRERSASEWKSGCATTGTGHFRRGQGEDVQTRSSPPSRRARAPGLGLSMSYDIVVKQTWWGRSRADTQPGDFTEFTVTLPRQFATSASPAREIAQRLSRGGPEALPAMTNRSPPGRRSHAADSHGRRRARPGSSDRARNFRGRIRDGKVRFLFGP